jgi:heme/copper-type cytochrome/quinol oxidase subunit 4
MSRDQRHLLPLSRRLFFLRLSGPRAIQLPRLPLRVLLPPRRRSAVFAITTLALIVVCVVVHLVLACIFSRAKRLTWAKSKTWMVVALVFGPLAWLLWWLRHRDVGRPQASDTTIHQSLLAEPRASAPLLDSMRRSAGTCAGGESPILKPCALPAEPEAVVGAVSRHNARASAHAVAHACRAQHLPGMQVPQLPQHDDISEDMTDQ